ncbi:MnmC family methyltransferase [Pigmentibacter sp. JX0631]|uniref:MnmC family methyltransferase n=1 Tax=Pigmentibacter sp. JX0631 TaxID=2976982 RepID=UPI0024689848|nr:MnmC family methyltransferase [Pigmentibacter sp. JX0631]WGL60669.1 MnmC family methyltransferase [Pigmentibacter sp. JX0631]
MTLIAHFTNSTEFSVNFFTTFDNSLSISLQESENISELMHSLQGAFSETIYVYSPVISVLLEKQKELSLLSIGLGLGYIEIMIVSQILAKKKSILDSEYFCIQSFESNENLIYFFQNFFLGKKIPFLFEQAYKDILIKMSEYFKVSFEEIINYINKLIQNNKFILNNKFSSETILKKSVNGIFFDAFSMKSTPELWEINLINNILHKNHLLNFCCFSTYASRSMLKKQLKEHNFKIIPKLGFSGKRECIFAIKEK